MFGRKPASTHSDPARTCPPIASPPPLVRSVTVSQSACKSVTDAASERIITVSVKSGRHHRIESSRKVPDVCEEYQRSAWELKPFMNTTETNLWAWILKMVCGVLCLTQRASMGKYIQCWDKDVKLVVSPLCKCFLWRLLTRYVCSWSLREYSVEKNMIPHFFIRHMRTLSACSSIDMNVSSICMLFRDVNMVAFVRFRCCGSRVSSRKVGWLCSRVVQTLKICLLCWSICLCLLCRSAVCRLKDSGQIVCNLIGQPPQEEEKCRKGSRVKRSRVCLLMMPFVAWSGCL